MTRTVAAVAFVPASPMLVPAIAAGAAADLAQVRAACHIALDRVLSAAADEILIIGSAACEAGPGARGSARGFGVDLTVWLHPGITDDGTLLPWPQTVGAWLLGERRLDLPRRAAGARFEEPGGRTVIVAVGDGSACRTDKAPGAFHPEAQAFDDQVAAGLARGDLAGCDLEGSGLLVDATAVWSAVRDSAGGGWDAQLHCHSAPGGVGLLVASWVPG